ncbi:MAG: 50S ribosomal protein L24 [Candidatus Caenarcaniphilales bacterium]|nr:50S ribosomal protein L24 [Candidatus Caenarcaniphilales bacterium]
MPKELKKKIRYTNSPIKALEKSDRIVLNESFLKGRRNPQRNWDIKLGDTVIILSGSDKGKIGKVLQVIPKEAKVIVEGVNVLKRHRRLPNEQEGQIQEKPFPIHICKVAHVVEVDGVKKPTRIRRDAEGKRIAIKTGEVID